MVNTRSATKNMKQAMVASDHHSTQPHPQVLVGSNDDLLTEILLRLPVTSILRFKSVSKHWRWLLSHRDFTHRYDNNKLVKSPGLIVGYMYIPFAADDRRTPPFISLDSYFNSHVQIDQSCYGLLLCCSDRWSDCPKYYIFNPTTKQLAIIPSVPGCRNVHRSIHFMGLAFHPTDCVHYNLVCIRALKPDGDSFQILIYSSETNKWMISIESFFARKPIFHNPVFWNGAVHWISDYREFMYMKIDDDQLQTLPLPEGFKTTEVTIMYFGESRGHLHLIVDDNMLFFSLRANVYEMLSNHSGWFVKYQLALDVIPVAFPDVIVPHGYHFQVIDVVRGEEEEEEDTFVVLKTCQNIITYNVRDKSFKQIFSPTNGNLFVASIYRYNETLSSF